MTNSRSLLWLRALLIVAAGCWVFSPVFRGDWLMDDDLYLTQNALLNDPARWWKIWFQPGSLIEYYPIEATLQAIQWKLWGTETLGYHLTNLALHLVAAFLVWRLLGKFGLRYAWLGGLLFVIHPVVVESVAWIAEFKNVLSLPPFLLAMCAWINYEEKGQKRDYLLALGFFLIAMLCKISMALFPLILLLYAWWKRGRLGIGDIKTSAPFLLISLVLGVTTICVGSWFREAHLMPMGAYPIGGIPSRLALAGLSLSAYFQHFLWPVGLLPIYAKWSINPPSPGQFVPWAILLGMVYWCWKERTSWGRHVLLGLGFFVINLLPFIGLNSVSYMTFTWIMDHFLYLPMIGLIGLAIAGMEKIEGGHLFFQKPLGASILAAVMTLLLLESHTYAGMYVSQETLWTYTLTRNPDAWLARNNLGNVYLAEGRTAEAIYQYQRVLELRPFTTQAHNNLGVALEQLQRPAEAIPYFQAALKLNPNFAMAQVNLANALSQLGRKEEAVAHYEEALRIDPHYTEARTNLDKLRAEMDKR